MRTTNHYHHLSFIHHDCQFSVESYQSLSKHHHHIVHHYQTGIGIYYYMYLPLYYHVDVFILQACRPKHELFSSQRVFWCWHAKYSPTARSNNKSDLCLLLDFPGKFPFVMSCGLIVDGKYIGCLFLVKLYTSHQTQSIFLTSIAIIKF